MNKRILSYITCSVILASLPAIVVAQQDKVDIVTGIGMVIGSGYHDAVVDAYPNVSLDGGYGWLDFQLGAQVNITEQLSITPGVDLWVNFVTGAEEAANTIILPSVALKYSFTEIPSFYVRGALNFNIPNMGLDAMDADGGAGFEITGGYVFGFGMDIELGYAYTPVSVNSAGGELIDEDYDFGGLLFRARYAF